MLSLILIAEVLLIISMGQNSRPDFVEPGLELVVASTVSPSVRKCGKPLKHWQLIAWLESDFQYAALQQMLCGESLRTNMGLAASSKLPLDIGMAAVGVVTFAADRSGTS